jgi:drug/metabolite transporter (DMT)-like permease
MSFAAWCVAEMDAVALAVVSAALFGAMTVALRFALRRNGDAELGAAVTVGTACVLTVALAAAAGPDELRWRELALFLLAGVLAPGGSQLLFTFAVRDAGASRASVVVGTAPLVAVVIALLVLGEPFRAPLVVGAVLIVAGGVALVLERGRPEHLRAVGLAFAFGCTTLFAMRDNFVRWFSGETVVDALPAAAATLLGGSVVVAAYLVAARRSAPSLRGAASFVVVGLLFGLSYVALFEAYYRGRVSVVSPLVATETLWGVGLSALLLRHTELVGRRLAVGAALIVAGGALIGAFR